MRARVFRTWLHAGSIKLGDFREYAAPEYVLPDLGSRRGQRSQKGIPHVCVCMSPWDGGYFGDRVSRESTRGKLLMVVGS